MAERTCHNCVYSCCDPGLWLRLIWRGETMVPRCANHPNSPGRLVDVTGVPCRNYRPKPGAPYGDSVRMIPLGGGSYAYVDAADYEWLSQWNWYCINGYAVRREKGKRVFMHRQIMRPPKGKIVDHVDGNKTNNCRSNLRTCTRQENIGNSRPHGGSRSRFKGICYRKGMRKWVARCQHRRDRRTLGYFDDEAEAARAYDHLAVECFKQFAKLNFPEEWPPERRAEVYAQAQKSKEEVKKPKRKTKEAKRKKPAAKPKTNSTRATGHGSRSTAHKPRSTASKPRATSDKRRATNKACAETPGQSERKKAGRRRTPDPTRATGHKSRAPTPKRSERKTKKSQKARGPAKARSKKGPGQGRQP